MGIEDPRTRAAHLLRRAGFGPTADEIEHVVQIGFPAAVAELVNFDAVADPAETAAEAHGLDLTTPDGLRAWWLFRMIGTTRPLQEKMTLFWHGHFATSIAKVRDPLLMRQQNELFRANALGSFRDLLRAVSRDPAMLRWLDGNTNRKASPNENYARELLELFTLGIGNYAESDVKAAARAFTGWFVDPLSRQFRFTPQAHDNRPKTFLGQTGNHDGDDIIEIILQQPAASQHLARRLFRFFAYDDPEPETVQRFAGILRDADFAVKPVVEAILLSPEFSSPRAYHAKVKSPTELVVGAIRQLAATTDLYDLLPALRRMGQDLFAPPNVKGWDGGSAWISTSTMLERFNFANRLCTARDEAGRTSCDPAALLARAGTSDTVGVVDQLLQILVDGDVPAEVRASLVAYMHDGAGLNGEAGDIKLRGLVHLIMSTPVYQSA